MLFSRGFHPKPAYLILGLLVLGTGGCTQQNVDDLENRWDMFRMTYKVPSGYHYNLEPEPEAYRGPRLPKPTAEDAAVETVTTYKKTEVETVYAPVLSLSPDQWVTASEDLVGRLLAAFGTPAEAIYLTADDPANPLNAPFAAALERALEARGLRVAPPGMGPFGLRYSARRTESSGAPHLNLTVVLTSAQQAAAEESGLYPLDGRMATAPAIPPAAPAVQAPAGSQPLSLIRPY